MKPTIIKPTSLILCILLAACGSNYNPSNPTTPQAQAPIVLIDSKTYGIVADPTITLNGTSIVSGDVAIGPDPGLRATSLIGPGTVNGAVHNSDPTAAMVKSDVEAALNDVSTRQSGVVDLDSNKDLTMLPSPPFGYNNGIFKPGLYRLQVPLTIAPLGTITLDAQGDPNAVFIFEGTTSITVGDGSTIVLANGAQAKNVWWAPTDGFGSISVTIGVNSIFNGNILSLIGSVTVLQGATIHGRILTPLSDVTVNTGSIIIVP